ncbi:hypothetical protein Plhal304r1_c031g0099841 [Plasmopara halstedii]
MRQFLYCVLATFALAYNTESLSLLPKQRAHSDESISPLLQSNLPTNAHHNQVAPVEIFFTCPAFEMVGKFGSSPSDAFIVVGLKPFKPYTKCMQEAQNMMII